MGTGISPPLLTLEDKVGMPLECDPDSESNADLELARDPISVAPSLYWEQ